MGGSESSETSRFCPFPCVFWTSACWRLFDWSYRTGGETVALNIRAFSYKLVLIVLGVYVHIAGEQGSPVGVAGDEKLFHFTGDSAFIRSVPSKPDAIGLWYFELACKIAGKDPYMWHIWLSESSTALGLHIPVSSVTEKWAKIAKEQNPPPLVTFDSYYTDLRGTRMISSMGVPYVGALHPSRFPAMVAMMDAHFKTLAASSTGVLRNQDSQELFIKHNDNTVGMKYVRSNAYSPPVSTRSGQQVVPIFVDFSSTFSVCDKGNKSLINCLYLFSFSGHGTKGVHGNVYKLAMMRDELSISLIATASAMQELT
eukprot:gene22521-27490_t